MLTLDQLCGNILIEKVKGLIKWYKILQMQY